MYQTSIYAVRNTNYYKISAHYLLQVEKVKKKISISEHKEDNTA